MSAVPVPIPVSVCSTAPSSDFASWLSLEGCQIKLQTLANTTAATVTDGIQVPSLMSLIRSSGEQQLLRTISESATQMDELMNELELEGIRARWQARANKARLQTDSAAKTSQGDPLAPSSSLASLFEKFSSIIDSLRSNSLPALQSSAHLNHLLSGELEAEGCAPLAASKKRVAEAEEALTRRITALLEGKLTVDEQSIRQEFIAAHTGNTSVSPVKANKSDHDSKEDSSDHTSSSSSSIPLGQPDPSNHSSLSLHASTPPSSNASSSSSSASAIVAHNSPLILAQPSPAVPQSKPTSPARHSGSQHQQSRSPVSSQKQNSEAAFISTPPQTSGGLASLVDLQTPLHSRTAASAQSPASGSNVDSSVLAPKHPSAHSTPVTPAASLPQGAAVCGCTPCIDGVHSCKLRSPPMRTPSQVRNDANNHSANTSANIKQNHNGSANASLTSQLNSTLPSQSMSCSQPGALDSKSRDDTSSLVLSFVPGNSLGASQTLIGEDAEQEPLVLSLNHQMSQQVQHSSSQGDHLLRSQFTRPSQAMSMLSPVLDGDVMADVDASSSSASRRSPVYDADCENEEKDPSQASEPKSEVRRNSVPMSEVAPSAVNEAKQNQSEPTEEEHPPFAAPNLFDNDLPFPQSAPAPSSTKLASSSTLLNAAPVPSRSASQQLDPPPRSKKSYQSPVKTSHTQLVDQDESSQAGGGSGSGWKKKRKMIEAPIAASSQVVSSTTSPLRTSERAKKVAKH